MLNANVKTSPNVGGAGDPREGGVRSLLEVRAHTVLPHALARVANAVRNPYPDVVAEEDNLPTATPVPAEQQSSAVPQDVPEVIVTTQDPATAAARAAVQDALYGTPETEVK